MRFTKFVLSHMKINFHKALDGPIISKLIYHSPEALLEISFKY